MAKLTDRTIAVYHGRKATREREEKNVTTLQNISVGFTK